MSLDEKILCKRLEFSKRKIILFNASRFNIKYLVTRTKKLGCKGILVRIKEVFG